MANWMKVLLLVVALPACVISRRFEQRSSKSSIGDSRMVELPEATKTALKEWLHPQLNKQSGVYEQKYRYIIMELPDMIAHTAPADKNYADFAEHLKSCNGVCIGAHLFTYGEKRTKPVLFSWAPDDPRTEFQKGRGYGRLKMQLSWYKSAVKKALDDGVGVFLQANDDDELDPASVVPSIPGMGTRVENLKPEGQELYDEVMKEWNSGSSGVPPPPMEVPDEKEEPAKQKPVPKPDPPVSVMKPTAAKPKSSPTGESMAASKEQIDQIVKDAFATEKDQIISSAEEAARAAISDEVQETAKRAAKEAVAAAFKNFAETLE